MAHQGPWDHYLETIAACQPIALNGRIVKIAGIVVEANGPGVPVGSHCAIRNPSGPDIPAEVVGFRDNRVMIMPFGEMRGIRPGTGVVAVSRSPEVAVGPAFLGRVLDGLGGPLDGKTAVRGVKMYPVYGNVVNPMEREIIRDVIDVGVRSINGLTSIGKGQRMAIMAGSGVGKSVLMGMIARNTAADVVVIALIGERGREVREFIERTLGDEGLKKAVVIVATSDAPVLIRIRAAFLATTVAEYFRDQGKDVILMMDSITRFAMALREVGLAAGEPPSAKGYTPSVFMQLPRLMERAGAVEGRGSITGIYTVLVEGDDMNEPVADAVRSISDGHIVLSRALAHKGHYPSVDVLASVSRVMKDIVDPAHMEDARRLLKILAVYRKAEDLIRIGAYSDGTDPEIDTAKRMMGRFNAFLQQEIEEKEGFEETVSRLHALFAEM